MTCPAARTCAMMCPSVGLACHWQTVCRRMSAVVTEATCCWPPVPRWPVPRVSASRAFAQFALVLRLVPRDRFAEIWPRLICSDLRAIGELCAASELSRLSPSAHMAVALSCPLAQWRGAGSRFGRGQVQSALTCDLLGVAPSCLRCMRWSPLRADSSLARLIRAQVCDRLFYLTDYLFMSDFED